MSKNIDVNSIDLLDLETDLGNRLKDVDRLKKEGSKKVLSSKSFLARNPGIEQRRQRDISVSETDHVRISLAKKAKLYESLKKDAVNLKDSGELLVDFERKRTDYEEHSASPSSEEEDHEMVEIVDDLGRTRKVLKKHLYKYIETEKETLTMRQFLQREGGEYGHRTPTVHYDDFDDTRERGVGYYRLSSIQEERDKQLEDLSRLREETMEEQKLRRQQARDQEERIAQRLAKFKARLQNSNTIVFLDYQ